MRAAVILLPDGPADRLGGEPAAARLILDAADAAGLRACDAAAALAGDDPAGPFLTPGGALTRAGHARLAELLAEFLLSPPRRGGGAG